MNDTFSSRHYFPIFDAVKTARGSHMSWTLQEVQAVIERCKCTKSVAEVSMQPCNGGDRRVLHRRACARQREACL